MDRRVIPPKRVTSPTWGPPPPCKQALSYTFLGGKINVVRDLVHFFFYCCSFSSCIGGRYHFSFCHRRYKNLVSKVAFFKTLNLSITLDPFVPRWGYEFACTSVGVIELSQRDIDQLTGYTQSDSD